MKLYAANRLLATEAGEVTAQFNTKRDSDLRQIQVAMQELEVVFSFGMHYLFHKSNAADVVREAQHVADKLNKLGWALRINDGVFDREQFALKGKEGLILQRVNHNLRIFYSK